jgi:membrane protease YdiL (CAAX protease family)
MQSGPESAPQAPDPDATPNGRAPAATDAGNPGPRPTQTGAIPRLWAIGASVALVVSLAAGMLLRSDPVAELRSPELVASHQVERPVELLDGLGVLAAEAGAPAGSGLPEEWRSQLLSGGVLLLRQAVADVETLARGAGQMPALPAEQAESETATGAPAAGADEAPLDWSTEALRLRLKWAALQHMRGQRDWRVALDADFASVDQQELLAAAGALLQRAAPWADGRELGPIDPTGTELEAPADDDDQPVDPAPAIEPVQEPLAGEEPPPDDAAPAQTSRPILTASEQARRFDALGEGLAASHLRRLAADAAGLSELAGEVKSRYEQRTRDRAELLAGRFGLGLLLLAIGGLFLIAMPFLGRQRLLFSAGPGPAGTFGLVDGWSVWAIYALGYQLILGVLGQFDPEHRTGLLVPIASLPLIALVHGLIARRSGRSTLDLFGLQLLPGRFGRLILFTLGAWVLTLIGVYALAMGPLSSSGGGSWANPMFDLLINSSPSGWRGLTLEAGLWAPIFEELAFRAVLFAGLRSRLGFVPAMLLSSALFGLFHSYGWPGNLLIAWVGCLLCWCYERTRSLFPGILLHSLFNLGQLSMMELYR